MQDPDSAERMWVLKTTAHRGQGVFVLPQQQAITAVLASSAEEDATAEMVQEYKSEQYTVAGRRFYLRCGRTWCTPAHQVGYARCLHCDAAYLIPLHDQTLLPEILCAGKRRSLTFSLISPEEAVRLGVPALWSHTQ